MHLQEVFRAIYANHVYEYLVVDKEFKVVERSDEVKLYCDTELLENHNQDLFALVPELFGMEQQLIDLLEGRSTPILVPNVFKEPECYVNIRVHLGKRDKTLIVLFENVTEVAKKDQALVQDANEKTLLLEELAEKNTRLKEFSEKMQELVEIETKKNIQKQRMLEITSRHAQMGEMIGMITHQWKQPLNAINSLCILLEMLQRKNELSERMLLKQVSEIKKQVEFMNRTVIDFQHFFNPTKIKRNFNVKKTIDSILGLIRSEYEIKNIHIELTGNDSVVVKGYANEYNQVLLSIIKNAKDAFLQNPKEGMKISIDVSKEDERSVVCIRDNAGGIDEKIIDKIFDLYVSTKEEGSGIGLSIAKTIIETHMEGRLSVCNIEGGTEFRIVV